jgi:hypothetical protein
LFILRRVILRKFLKYVLLTLAGIVGFVLLFILISVAPVNRTPARDLPFYQDMMASLNGLQVEIPKAEGGFSIGFSKVNITPSHPLSTAGYIKRKGRPYYHVHDSIFARAMVIDNGAEKVAIVSADLLIMPPTVTNLLPGKLAKIGFDLNNTYLSVTHSHNSIGHWSEGATRFIYGAYDDSVVHSIADAIVRSISAANSDRLPAKIRRGAIPVPRAVENRLIDGGVEDSFLRVIEVQRADSSRAVLLSYSAHATCLSGATIELSRDYPGMVVDAFEERGYAFAMFLAGAVGSHKGSAPENDWACMSWMSEQITNEFFANRTMLKEVADTSLVMTRVQLPVSKPQLKITEDWRLRPWVFRSVFGENEAFLTALRIGDVVMFGTPCDFSGEFSASIDSLAAELKMSAMVTSFNGGYIGYVTPEKYYDVDHYETRIMNWYAPGTGEYMKECLGKLMIAVSDTR